MRTRFFAQGCVEASTLTTLVATFATTVPACRSTGLPFFHGIRSGSGGFRWRRSVAVAAPSAAPIC